MSNQNMQPLDLINVPLDSVNLIEASAGTGKTYAISNLYLRFVLEKGFHVQSILVVTFTEAATKELKERLRNILDEAYSLLCMPELEQALSGDSHLKAILRKYCCPTGDWRKLDAKLIEIAQKRLRLAVVSFDEAAIFTIHGFCQRMLNENACESNMPFDLELMTQDNDLLKQVVHDFWRKFAARDDLLTKTLLGNNLIALDKLLELAKTLRKKPDIVPFLVQTPVNCPDFDAIFNKLKRLWKAQQNQIIAILKDKDNKLSRAQDKYKEAVIDENAKILDQISEDCPTIEPIKKFAYASLNDAITDSEKKKGVEAKPHRFFTLCDQFLDTINQKKADILRDFVQHVQKKFGSLKRSLNVMSFDDMLLNLREALKKDESKRFHALIRSRFKVAMIDEFQDTDPVQCDIFRSVFMDDSTGNHSGSHAVFLIGDPKQSIYKFRGADIFAYLDAKKLAKKCWTLDTNFRSEADLVSAVNYLFIQDDNATVSGFHPFVEADIPFYAVKSSGRAEKDGRLMEDAEYQRLLLEILYIDNPESSDDKPLNADKGRALATEATARKIVELLKKGRDGAVRFVSEENKKEVLLKPSDIAALVRSHKEARMLQQALSRYGVPSVLQSTGNIFASDEAKQFVYLLAAVAEPSERTLRPLLLTPFVDMGFEHLKDISDAEMQTWHQQLLELNELWKRNGFMSMFNRFMRQNSVKERFLSKNNGERALTNILHLAELLNKQVMESKLGSDGLAKWFDEMISEPEEKPEYELYLERDADAVRILTVHASKGLEFKIVFCPFEWSRHYAPYWLKDASCLEFYDRKNGHWGLDLDKNGLAWQGHKECVWQDELAENLRLLYVAVTRARNKCFLVAGKMNNVQLSALNYLLRAKDFKTIATYISEMNPTGNGSTKKVKELVEEMQKYLERLASSSKGLISTKMLSSERLTAPFSERFTFTQAQSTQLEPVDFSETIETDWGIGSFTWLTKNIGHGHQEAEPVKGSEEVEVQDVAAAPISLLAKTPPLLPPGARTGSAVHEMFEELDFVKQTNLDGIVREKLKKYGIGASRDQNIDELVEHTKILLQNVLKTSIPAADNLMLDTVSKDNRLNELEFFYPIQNISPGVLVSVFKTHGTDVSKDFSEQLGRLGFSLKNGFMGGFIDLFFEHNGRYYVLDWKTNWLGDSHDAYSDEAIKQVMYGSYYVLQYHLYTVAMHLYLQNKMHNYDYDKHFGGVVYVFVRGMTPEKPGHSVFFDKPCFDLISNICKALGLEKRVLP